MRKLRFQWKVNTRHWIVALFLFTAILIAALVGRSLFTAPTVVYPASGIALAVLFLEGILFWPVIVLASFASHLLSGSPIVPGIVLSCAHALQAVAGAYLLKRFAVSPLLSTMRDIAIFMAVSVVVATIVPTLGMWSLLLNSTLNGTPFLPGVTWSSWWVGMVLSLFVLSSALIRWLGQITFTRSTKEWIEISLSFTMLAVIAISIFWLGIGQMLSISMVYFMLVPLFWIAFRLGSRFMTAAILTLSVIGITGIIWGIQPIAPDVGQRLFQTEIFLIIIALIFYTVTALDEERRRATLALKSQIKKLTKAYHRLSTRDRAKSDFLAILAHELRNPLAPVVSALEIFRMGSRSKEEADLLEVIDGRLKTMRRLLDDLLDVSRISNEKLELRRERVMLCPIVQTAAASVKEAVVERSQTLTVNLLLEPVWVYVDSVRIEQVLTNLLTNASKFTNSGGTICVTVRVEGNEAEIEVLDTGKGIPRNMVNRIFEPFLQVESTTKHTGLGIGLSLVKRLTEMHGGTISATSNGPGTGSIFTVRLPIAEQDAVTEKTSILPPSQSKFVWRVLVVDDNVQAAQGIGKLLELSGHHVAYAATGKEAIQRTSDWYPNAVVLDIGLPDMDGYQVAQILRSDTRFDGVLVALTGYGTNEDKQKSYEVGFDYHLVKPVSLAELMRCLTPVR